MKLKCPAASTAGDCCFHTRSVIIMIPAAGNDDRIIDYAVDDAVRVIDPSAPPAAQAFIQRFRFADPIKRRSQDILDQQIVPLQRFSVLTLSPQIVFPAILMPQQAHVSVLRQSVFRQFCGAGVDLRSDAAQMPEV